MLTSIMINRNMPEFTPTTFNLFTKTTNVLKILKPVLNKKV